MVRRSASKASKPLEPPLAYLGATPDADRAQQPALPKPPYKPYTQEPAPTEYKPYAQKPGVAAPPYEPYKGI